MRSGASTSPSQKPWLENTLQRRGGPSAGQRRFADPEPLIPVDERGAEQRDVLAEPLFRVGSPVSWDRRFTFPLSDPFELGFDVFVNYPRLSRTVQ